MKSIKFKIFTLALLLTSITFVSCSTESTDEIENPSSSISMNKLNSQAHNYIKSFYDKSFVYGISVETSDDKTNYVLTEVIVNSENRARGYVVTERGSDKFLYFVDVDRTNSTLTTYEVNTNEKLTFNEIDKNEHYLTTDKFDFIKIVNEANGNPQSTSRFWGWGNWLFSPCIDGKQNKARVYHVFWLSAYAEVYEDVPC